MADGPIGSELIAGGTFLEPTEVDDRLGYALKVDKVLLKKRTAFQDLAVVESGPLGRMLVLDGCIQTSPWDEAGYHEMLVHVPLLSHPDPRKVLIIGGGDGGTLREVLRHPSVTEAHLCEIDGEVISASREFLPQLSAGAFDDPRAHIHVADGIEFVARHQAAFDVILVDSSDPEGPALALFGADFYAGVKRALRPGGLVASQAESWMLYPELLQKIFGFLPGLFPTALYYTTYVPTYTCGLIGFALGSLGPDPLAAPDPARVAALGRLRYYTPSLHRAAFALPQACLDLLPPAVARAQERL